MHRGFKTWAEQKSIQLRSELQVAVNAYLSAAVLARHLKVIVIGPSDLPGIADSVLNELLIVNPDLWSAVTIPIDGRAVIVHNTCHAPARQESNLMHELAHVICSHKGAKIQCSGKLPWAFRTYDRNQEEEASWLGACLQVPRDGLIWAMCEKKTEVAVAEHFRASIPLIRFRRNTTGADMHRRRIVQSR